MLLLAMPALQTFAADEDPLKVPPSPPPHESDTTVDSTYDAIHPDRVTDHGDFGNLRHDGSE